MKSLFICPSLVIILFAGSCKPAKDSSTTETTPTPVHATKPAPGDPNTLSGTTQTQNEDVAASSSKQSENSYRFIVSFISIGEGTDRTAKPILDGIVAEWEKKTGKTIAVEPIAWGREGETDFCYQLKELTSKEQESFVNQVRTAFKDHSLIQITENQPCMHKR